ncbi:MAG: hypothetical protein NVSMB42_03690 [Herpetosiphon sp.]
MIFPLPTLPSLFAQMLAGGLQPCSNDVAAVAVPVIVWGVVPILVPVGPLPIFDHLPGNGKRAASPSPSHSTDDELLRIITSLLRARDAGLARHSVKVADYAALIAAECGLPSRQRMNLRQAALLHDIGKLAIPEAILNKRGRLDDGEYELVKTHSDVGAAIVAETHLRHLAPIIRHHHECWDGTGYSAGLRGIAIPVESRILSVADTIDAMASDRPYQRAQPAETICAELVHQRGTQFDPWVVDACVRIFERHGHHWIVNSAALAGDHRPNEGSVAAGAS